MDEERNVVVSLSPSNSRHRLTSLLAAYREIYADNDSSDEMDLHHLTVDLLIGLAERGLSLRELLEGSRETLNALGDPVPAGLEDLLNPPKVRASYVR